VVAKDVDADCLFKDERNDDEVIHPEPRQDGISLLPGSGYDMIPKRLGAHLNTYQLRLPAAALHY
jgi:hypothetical protein